MEYFELTSLPDRDRARLFLIQNPYRVAELKPVEVPTSIAALDGTPLDAAKDMLGELAGVDKFADFLKTSGRVSLSEQAAIRLGLMFHGIQGLRAEARIRQVIETVKEMDAEEARFWLKKIIKANAAADPRGLDAFRVNCNGQ